MSGFPPPPPEEGSRPLLLLGASLLLIGVLLFASRFVGGGTDADPGARNAPGARPPAGNYQPAPMVPNTPITSLPGGSPVNDTPDVTIVNDVRETLHRLPLDRNHPRGWTNPGVKRKK